MTRPSTSLGQLRLRDAVYRILELGNGVYEVERPSDGVQIGFFMGSVATTWQLHPKGGGAALLREIVRQAIREGILIGDSA